MKRKEITQQRNFDTGLAWLRESPTSGGKTEEEKKKEETTMTKEGGGEEEKVELTKERNRRKGRRG